MSTVSSVRTFVRPATPAFSFGRAVALLAGAISAGVDLVMTRAELARSRRQLAQLDERLLRDIGLDRMSAQHEASKGYFLS